MKGMTTIGNRLSKLKVNKTTVKKNKDKGLKEKQG